MKMISIPSLLALLMPVPALRQSAHDSIRQMRRRRAVAALRLEPHLLRDVGLEDYEHPQDDPRWVRQFDLER